MPQQPLAPLPCKAQRFPERNSSSYRGIQSDLSQALLKDLSGQISRSTLELPPKFSYI